MNASVPAKTQDLLPSERRMVDAMRELGFGRFEYVQIVNGQLVLDPWPTTIRSVKFRAEDGDPHPAGPDFALKHQVIELFEYVRGVEAGEILALEFRHGLPFSMEIETGANRPFAGGVHA